MSTWTNVKKSVARAGASGITDPEFNEQEQRFHNLERRIMRLMQETKGYKDGIADMTKAQKELADSLSAFLIDVQRPQEYQAAYRQAATVIDTNSRPQFDEVYTHTILEPLSKYCGYIPEFNKAIGKRATRGQDLQRARKQLQKEESKAGHDPIIIEKAEQDVQYAEVAYENINRALITETPKLINSRVYVIDPSFEAFVKAQLQFFSDSSQQMEQVARLLPPEDPQNDDRVLTERVDNVMGQLRSLSICSLNV